MREILDRIWLLTHWLVHSVTQHVDTSQGIFDQRVVRIWVIYVVCEVTIWEGWLWIGSSWSCWALDNDEKTVIIRGMEALHSIIIPDQRRAASARTVSIMNNARVELTVNDLWWGGKVRVQWLTDAWLTCCAIQKCRVNTGVSKECEGAQWWEARGEWLQSRSEHELDLINNRIRNASVTCTCRVTNWRACYHNFHACTLAYTNPEVYKFTLVIYEVPINFSKAVSRSSWLW